MSASSSPKTIPQEMARPGGTHVPPKTPMDVLLELPSRGRSTPAMMGRGAVREEHPGGDINTRSNKPVLHQCNFTLQCLQVHARYHVTDQASTIAEHIMARIKEIEKDPTSPVGV
jgi:hypothetical protein